MSKLSHLDEDGKARMVDVSGKGITAREATAKGRVLMARETLELVAGGTNPKGDVLAVARIAGIMAAKRTGELIPLCHPLALDQVTVDFALDEANSAIDITATAKLSGKTGVEMEALTAVSVAALTLYDMLKAADKRLRITDIFLTRKSGGRSGTTKAK